MWKVSHIDSFSSRSTRELGNGLLELKRRCSWLDNIRLIPMSCLTWPVKIKHKRRSLKLLFFSGPSPWNAPKIPFRETKSTPWKSETNSPYSSFCLGHSFRPGPRDPKRMTAAKYWGIGTRQIFIHDLLKDRQKILIFTAVEYLRCDIVIDLCRARFKRRILHAPNILHIWVKSNQ